MGAVRFEAAKVARCRVCGLPVLFLGPEALANSKRLCSPVCVAIDDAMTPGMWLDASVALQGDVPPPADPPR